MIPLRVNIKGRVTFQPLLEVLERGCFGSCYSLASLPVDYRDILFSRHLVQLQFVRINPRLSTATASSLQTKFLKLLTNRKVSIPDLF